MTIQRYIGENVEFHATGDMVAYEDYAELKEEYERLDKSHSAALAKIDNLAAENAALKAFGDKLNDMHNDLNGEGTGIHGRAEVACQQIALEAAMEEFDTIKTPATDACAASLRAEGVEMFVEHCKNSAIVKNYDFWMDASACAESFSAQLRSKSEVQS